MKLKKCINLVLVFLLLVSNTGFAFNVHYCGNSISGISLQREFSKSSEKNCCGVAIKKSNCCKNKVVHFQKKSDNVVVKAISFQSQMFVPTMVWQTIAFTLAANFKNDTNTSYYCDAHAPPLFKLYSQYIFYDRF